MGTVHGPFFPWHNLRVKHGLCTESGSHRPIHVRWLSGPYRLLLTHILDIEAEIRYAVRHEYAQTAVDFIARRCRLAFLNASMACGALPLVVDIMASELGWSHTRKAEELRRGVKFLRSMGLQGVPEDLYTQRRSWKDWIESNVFGGEKTPKLTAAYSRASFGAGEIDAIGAAFEAKADRTDEGGGEKRLARGRLLAVIRELPGYEEARPQHLENVLTEVGFEGRGDIALDEFLEVSGGGGSLLIKRDSDIALLDLCRVERVVHCP